ncbi:hypothetical protein J6590_033483 [Homalodisca vitripennis]|nr:hypothetical protein J6590_033483 [Homalodisca vitripennis]
MCEKCSFSCSGESVGNRPPTTWPQYLTACSLMIKAHPTRTPGRYKQAMSLVCLSVCLLLPESWEAFSTDRVFCVIQSSFNDLVPEIP